MGVMNYWIQHDAERPLAIRAAGDPYADPDVVPEYWGAASRRWISDADLNGEIFWNPNISSASQADIEKLIRASGAA